MSVDQKEWTEAIAAAQSWWREAGVDLAYIDEPTDWLASARARSEAAAEMLRRADAPPPRPRPDPPARAVIGGDSSKWPATLADWAGWWLTEPSLDPAPANRRVLPTGPADAALMVLVPAPEPDDREALLSGRAGQLLEAILAAFGLGRGEVYCAAILPAAHPVADWGQLAADGMGRVLAHHVALAAPRRLIVFGRDVSPLLGHDPAQVAQSSLRFNHEGGSVPLAFAPALDALLERPALKRGVWTRWLEWTGD